MKEYVLGFRLFRETDLYGPDKDEAIFVHKNRPAWQNNKINLPGGAVEHGETPEQAIMREFKEETGIKPDFVEKYGEIIDGDSRVYCLFVKCTSRVIQPRPEETEKVEWIAIDNAIQNPALIPNLKVIIPLMICGVKDWVIIDSVCSDYQNRHTLSITIPTK